MHRARFLPVCLSSFAVTLALLTPSVGRAAEQEVVRVGDREMSCPALATEINSLAQPASLAVAKPKKKKGFGLFSALGGAVPMLGMGGAMGGAMLSSVAGAAQQASAQDGMHDAMAESQRMTQEMLAGGSPAQQRKQRLTTIFEEKRC